MKQKAFTLIELLVVIGIIGILSAIGVVSFGAVREKARRGACIATLRSNFNSDENLVAYWNFDEQSPGTIAPTTAGAIKDFWGHNGTVFGDPPPMDSPNYQAGIIDSAMYFDGSLDYVEVSDNPDLDISNSITLETWIKHNGSVPWAVNSIIVHKGSAYGLWYDWTGTAVDNSQLQFMFQNPACANGWCVCNSTFTPLVNTWYHLAGVYDYNNGKCHFYVNGDLKKTNNYNQTINNGTVLRLGGWDAGVYPFNGLIDEVIIYNRALSADEIASHYKACKK